MLNCLPIYGKIFTSKNMCNCYVQFGGMYMKKIFKKLPFATFTASAATTTSTATVSAYGIIKGSDQGRFTDPKLTICNDAQDGNFTIGFVNFNVSNISCTDLDEVSASYNFTSAMASNCSEYGT